MATGDYTFLLEEVVSGTVVVRQINVSREAFLALSMFLGANKPAGSVTITFKNGNIAGVEMAMRSVLK